jgi:hypothetical protein
MDTAMNKPRLLLALVAAIELKVGESRVLPFGPAHSVRVTLVSIQS